MGQAATLDVGRAREQLYSRTVSLCANLADSAGEALVNSYLDSRVQTDAALFAASRTAGGRWQMASGGLVFKPW